MNIKEGTFTAPNGERNFGTSTNTGTAVGVDLGFEPHYIAIWADIDRFSSHDMTYSLSYLYLNGETTVGLMAANDKSYGSGSTHEGVDAYYYSNYITFTTNTSGFTFKNTFEYAGSDPILYSYLAIE